MRTLIFLIAAAAAAQADSILISEIVTDPQADHSENAGGNGVPYDMFPGTGTISSVDEFIELYNTASDPVDLTGFSLVFDDSTPSTYVFGTSTAGTLLYSAGSTLKALLPGGYVVLGNPPGVLNNTIEVRMYYPDQTLGDFFVVADGNAGGPGDEAISRAWYGDVYSANRLVRTSATPLGAPPPVSEPAGLVLALVSVVAAGAASRRKRRRGHAHRRCESPRARSCAP